MNFLTKLFSRRKKVEIPSVQLSNFIVELHEEALIAYILIRSVSGNWSLTVDSTTERYHILHLVFEQDANDNTRRVIETQVTMLYILSIRFLDEGFHNEVLKSLSKMDKRLAIRLPKYSQADHDKALKNAKQLHEAVETLSNEEE